MASHRRATTEADVLHGLLSRLHALEKIPHMFQRAFVVLAESFHFALGLLAGGADISFRIVLVLSHELVFGVFGPALERVLVIFHGIVWNQLGALFGKLDGPAIAHEPHYLAAFPVRNQIRAYLCLELAVVVKRVMDVRNIAVALPFVNAAVRHRAQRVLHSQNVVHSREKMDVFVTGDPGAIIPPIAELEERSEEHT